MEMEGGWSLRTKVKSRNRDGKLSSRKEEDFEWSRHKKRLVCVAEHINNIWLKTVGFSHISAAIRIFSRIWDLLKQSLDLVETSNQSLRRKCISIIFFQGILIHTIRWMNLSKDLMITWVNSFKPIVIVKMNGRRFGEGLIENVYVQSPELCAVAQLILAICIWTLCVLIWQRRGDIWYKLQQPDLEA